MRRSRSNSFLAETSPKLCRSSITSEGTSVRILDVIGRTVTLDPALPQVRVQRNIIYSK